MSLLPEGFDSQYFHTGVVVPSVPAAVEELEESLGLSFAEPSRFRGHVWFDTGARQVEFLYSYSRSGPPYLEVMEAVPGTPWVVGGRASMHLGYWVDDLLGTADALEGVGYQMIAKDAGRDVPRSYCMLAAPVSGAILELVSRANRDPLERWLSRPAWSDRQSQRHE